MQYVIVLIILYIYIYVITYYPQKLKFYNTALELPQQYYDSLPQNAIKLQNYRCSLTPFHIKGTNDLPLTIFWLSVTEMLTLFFLQKLYKPANKLLPIIKTNKYGYMTFSARLSATLNNPICQLFLILQIAIVEPDILPYISTLYLLHEEKKKKNI